MIKVGTFCSGIGAPEQALKNLNIEHSIEFAAEIDKHARETYLDNFNPKVMYEDLTQLDYNQLPDVNLFIAGFPCQAFSIAGKRKGFADKTRGTIFFNIYEYLKIKQPEIFILENVKGLVSHDSGNTFKTIIDLLAGSVNGQGFLFPHQDSLNYHVYYKVLNSKEIGSPEPVPQNRERIFIIGFKHFRAFNFPEKQKLNLKLSDLLEKEVPEKYFLSEKQFNSLMGGIQKSNLGQDLARSLQCPGNSCGNYRGMNMITEPKALTTTRTEEGKRKRSENIRNGKDYTSFSDSTLKPRNDNLAGSLYATPNPTKDNLLIEPRSVLTPDRLKKRQNGRRFKNEGEHRFTLTGQDKHGIYYQNRIRRLTPLECFRLQGFPDSFIKNASDTQLYKMAGNSITVNVLEAIFRQLLNIGE